jgi:hypothetical protein
MTKRKIDYWVIPPEADGEFVAHMEQVLETYAQPYEVRHFVPLLSRAQTRMSLTVALADAGYDSEANHQLSREVMDVRSAGGCGTHRPLPAADAAATPTRARQETLGATLASRNRQPHDQAEHGVGLSVTDALGTKKRHAPTRHYP